MIPYPSMGKQKNTPLFKYIKQKRAEDILLQEVPVAPICARNKIVQMSDFLTIKKAPR
jgi:hypothetical protein